MHNFSPIIQALVGLIILIVVVIILFRLLDIVL